MDIISIESLAMEAFATEEQINEFRRKVDEEERNKEQILISNKYAEYTNYSYNQHPNLVKYNRLYSNNGAYTEKIVYSAGGSTYTEYHRGYADYTYVAHDNKPYADYNDYNDYNRYSRYNDYNKYVKAYIKDEGFNHNNYVPSKPHLMGIVGSLVNDRADFIIHSYDKNKDGYGSTDEQSKTVKYTLKIRRVQTLTGQTVVENWITVLNNTTNNRLTLDTSSYKEGVYEIWARAINDPKTEKGITQKYESAVLEGVYFTISDNNIPILTALNADEFVNYGFGLDGKSSPSRVFTEYTANMYRNAGENQKQGLFIEFQLTDVDLNQYHKAWASLEKSDGTTISREYEIVFELSSDGVTPKAGNKKGVVFIPSYEYLDDGVLENVKVKVKVADYTDKNFTHQKGVTIREPVAVRGASSYAVINLDNNRPIIDMTSPHANWRISQNVQVNVSELPSGKLGAMNTYYKIVPNGTPFSDSDWILASDINPTIRLSTGGIWDIHIKATDKGGNVSYKVRNNYKIANVDITSQLPRYAFIGFPYKMSSKVTSAQLNPTSLIYKFGNGPSEMVTANNNGKAGNTTSFSGQMIAPDYGEVTKVLYVLVNFGDEQIIKTHNVEFLKVVPVTVSSSMVKHTAEWEANRVAFNNKTVYGRQRAANVFWSGERLCVEVKGYGIDHGRAELVGTGYSVNLSCPDFDGENYTDTLTWTGDIWHSAMNNKWGNSTPETFQVKIYLYDMAGNETIIKETIVFNNIDLYYRQSQKY